MKRFTVLIILFVSIALTIYSQDKQDTLTIIDKVTYQVGKAIVIVTAEKRQGEYGEFIAKNFKVEKIYKKGDKWESTNNFNLTELLQLRAAIDKAINEEGVKIKKEPK